MKTYTTLRNLTASYCNVSTSDTTMMSVIDTNVNDSIRTICNLQGGKLRFLESTSDMVTVADQESYQIPNKYRKLIDLQVWSGDGSSNTQVIYHPEMIFDPMRWTLVQQYRLGTQDVPYYVYVENTSFKIQPIPATSGNLIRLRGRLRTRDLSIADYTNASITALANGATAITAIDSTFTADMVGRYIKITETTAAGGGDGYWYEIGSFTDATHIGLTKPYNGLAVTSATSVIGQVSPIPEAYDVAIVYRATALYWQNQNDLTRAKTYWMMYDGGNEAGYSQTYGGLISQMLANEGETEEGAYIPPANSRSTSHPNGPWYYPYQDASGF